jgi:sugar lactone lactonase YvrE
MGDFNGDGILDLAVSNVDGEDNSNALAILLGNGDGTFKAAVANAGAGLSFKSVTVGDFNGDGIADLVVGEFWNGNPAIFLGRGDGTFAAGLAEYANSPLSSGYLAVADFNGDGIPDLAVPSQDGTVPILLAQPTQTVIATVSGISPAGPGPHQVAASYPGDSNYSSSISATTPLIVQVATPVISPGGGTYTSVQTVSITDTTPGATIYYAAANGFVPYTGPITVSGEGYESIQAYAVETGYEQSNYAAATYSLNLPPTAEPVISLASGVYPGVQTATISDAAPGTTIYYTTNGLVQLRAPRNIRASSSGIITTVAGNGNGQSCSSFGGDRGPATSAALCYPTGVSVDNAGNLYIADTSENRIRKATVSSFPPTVPAAAPTFTVSSGTYGGPQTVTITDATPGAAIYITMDGTSPSTLSPGYNGPINVSGSVTINAIAVAPGYLASTPVAAAYTITSPPQVITTVAGNGVYGFAGVGGPAISAEIGYPTGVAFDGAGNLYFSDTANNVIWMLSAKTGDLVVAAGNGTGGYAGDGGPAGNAQLYYPQGVAVDSAGNLYIADTANNVIRKVVAGTGLITTVTGNGAGSSPRNGDGGLATAARLSSPSGVALDNAGNLYIADTYDDAIRFVSASSGTITTVAGNWSSGFSGDGGPATSASINDPNAVALDGAGNLYISTVADGRIRKVAATTGLISTVAGNGNRYGNSGDGGLATSAEIDPQALTSDSAGNLYFSSWPGSVREVVASTGLIATVAGNGYLGYSNDGRSATVAEIADPQGISFDAMGNLYVADKGNSRVRRVTPSNTTAKPAFSVTPGSYSSVQSVAISDSTQGATIYYTTDGTTPTASSSVYTGPIAVSSSETIGAIATAGGYSASPVATAAYIINIPIGTTPIFSPSAGTYTVAQTVTISDATAGAAIHYTTDGTTPTTSSSAYTGPITISSSETIEAIATASGYRNSAVATAAYTLNIPTNPVPVLGRMSPAFTAEGDAAFTLTVTGSGFTSGSTVYWGTAALSTQFGSGTQLTAQVPASDIVAAGITAITVQTPTLGGGTSNSLQYEVDSATPRSTPPPSFTTLTATVAAARRPPTRLPCLPRQRTFPQHV